MKLHSNITILNIKALILLGARKFKIKKEEIKVSKGYRNSLFS
ncbi:hypothetical protein MSIBF_A2650009 [groundwater metagenome]|uniref:Uncharacterized protein n=1 Tax=groundwater metagenome TaxID=717931 RepID=A0A098E9M8_9ZZZZ